jgi:hypothetical protein
MTDIIERAARALAAYEYGDGFDEPWEPFVGMAKEVLRAIREPSEGMVRAANESDYDNIEGCSLEQLDLDIRIPWQAMIDAALGEDRSRAMDDLIAGDADLIDRLEKES